MSQKGQGFNIIHVEADPALAKLVQTAFKILGYRGRMITVRRMEEALNLLGEMERTHEFVNLILVNMQLPDGTGLDIIRKVKTDPVWRVTPVIALSGELAPGMVNAAYALGANCVLSRSPESKGTFESLHALYANWFEHALLPQAATIDLLQSALSRAVRLRARTAEFYLNLARAFEGRPEMVFWLDRSLSEGNLSNLLAFLQPEITESDASAETIERLNSMQIQVHEALNTAEGHLKKTPVPRPDQAYRWVLDLMGALNEEVVAEVVGYLFPKGPEATAALKARAAIQFRELAHHILERTNERKLRLQAERLRDWAEELAVQPTPQQETGRSKRDR